MFAEYQVIAVDKKGIESFASQPITVVDKKYANMYERKSDKIRKNCSFFAGSEGLYRIIPDLLMHPIKQ